MFNVYPKSEFALEEVSDKSAISMHLFAVHAGVRDHNSGNAFPDRVEVGRHVDAE